MAGIPATRMLNPESEVEPRNSLPAEVRRGLTSERAAHLFAEYGPNEVPKIEVPLWKLLLRQFVGLMPFMLEVCCVVSFLAEDYPDFGVIAAMLVINAALGFREELKAKRALEELTNSMESNVTCLRDGVTRLVPGDVIHMRGGTMTPADVEWLEGDVLQVDTAALTGEPIPRKYPSPEYGGLILSGTSVSNGEAYCVVRATGVNTEIGRGQADIAGDRSSATVSVFETKVMRVVNVIIFFAVIDTIVLLCVQGFVRDGFHESSKTNKETLLVALSILIAAVPVALPLVLQVTMAIGAYHMATDHHAIVTRMSALQDIASMDVLCSDKTGTLTTAKMSINLEAIWLAADAGFDALGCKSAEAQRQEMLLSFAYLASNPDKRDDAIDGAVIRAYEKMNAERGGAASKVVSGYKQLQLTGFTPEVKRTVAKVQDLSKKQTLVVAKGIATKVMDTSAGGKDNGDLQWCCAEVESDPSFKDHVRRQDEVLAGAGYKTLAVAVGVEGGLMNFLGLLPMIDPPRSDTKKTVRRILNAGVEVKMITGDHVNIAIETARLVGIPVSILPGEMVREASHARDDLVRTAGGFAQVLPKDKREVVQTLQKTHKLVVGMTGDGINDAPALSVAQCGIAVDDARDTAKQAAAMILTTEGLSAVFAAVVESRKIFKRLFSYIAYRLASTVQILVFLSLLVYVFDASLNPLYVILLALFNDVTMIPVAEDRQQASAAPQHASVMNLIGYSVMLGVVQASMSMAYYLCMHPLDLVKDLDSDAYYGYPKSTHAQNAIWLQVSISAELLIFAARAPGLFFLSRPSCGLFCSTMFGNIVSCVLAIYLFPHGLDWEEVGLIVAWDIAALFIVDIAKMTYKYVFEHEVAGVIDEAAMAREDAQEALQVARLISGDMDAGAMAVPLAGSMRSRHMGSVVSNRGSLAASVTDFLSTGRAPYHVTSHAASNISREPTLRRRTPATVVQEQSVLRQYRSF